MKRVLVSPLDWGLGHATRCIPIIRELQEQGCEVLIAGSGDALELLRMEFPACRFFSLPGYSPRYPVNGSMTFSMAGQLPRFISVVSSERRAVEKIVEEEAVDLVISDNRYGCRSARIPSVFITHQSNVLMPRRFGILQRPVRKLSERLIDKFNVCWIPDLPASDSLASALISFGEIDVKADIRYIGWLSRFELSDGERETALEVMAVLSGPEPQRTVFERILAPQLRASGLRFRVVRGLPGVSGAPGDGRFINFLTSRELQACIGSSELVIARSGYSTVMDMQALGKKVVFVPTPGQTEQEYLAARLMEKGIAFSMPQGKFDLATALRESKKFPGFKPAGKNHLLREAVRELLNR